MISGYLITLLLIGEHERSGRVSLGQFYLRRARRLLPALFMMLALVIVYTALFKRDELGRLRGDVLAAPRLRVQLVPDLGRPGVHGGRAVRSAAPPVEPGRRGAVLPRLAAA